MSGQEDYGDFDPEKWRIKSSQNDSIDSLAKNDFGDVTGEDWSECMETSDQVSEKGFEGTFVEVDNPDVLDDDKEPEEQDIRLPDLSGKSKNPRSHASGYIHPPKNISMEEDTVRVIFPNTAEPIQTRQDMSIRHSKDIDDALGRDTESDKMIREFGAIPGFMVHDQSDKTDPPIVLFIPNEAFTTIRPDVLGQLSFDPLRIHLKDIIDNLRATASSFIEQQVKILEKKKEDLEKFVNSRYTKFRNAELRDCTLSRDQGIDTRSLDISTSSAVHPEDDENFLRIKEQKEAYIIALENSIGRFHATYNLKEFSCPLVSVIIYRALGASGIPTGYFFILKINSPDIHFGHELEQQIRRRNQQFHHEAMERRTKMSKLDRVEKTSERGKFSFTHITSLDGCFGTRNSLSNAIDCYLKGESYFCDMGHIIRDTPMLDSNPVTRVYDNPIHPCNVFTLKTAIAKAKQSIGGLHPKQSDPSTFFKILEFEDLKKYVIAFRPEDAVEIPMHVLDPALGKDIQLPSSIDKQAGFDIVGEGISTTPEEILENLDVGEFFQWDKGTESFVSKLSPEQTENIATLPMQYRRLIESQLCQSDGGEASSFFITFPQEVVDRAYCLRKRAENANIIYRLSIEMDSIFEKMQLLQSKIASKPEGGEEISRMENWLNYDTSKEGTSFFIRDHANEKVWIETEDERKMFEYYITWLASREALQNKRLEMSRAAWKDMLRCNLNPEPFADATVKGMDKFLKLPPKKRWPDVCHHSVDDMSTYANMILYKQRGFQKLLKLIPGKPTSDCILLEAIFASAWRFNPGLHPNTMICGPNSSSKSFITELLSKYMEVDNVHKSTENAYNVGQDRLYKIHVQEEAQASMTGVKDGREMQGGDEQTKNRMTNSLIVTVQCWVDENGERKSTIHYSRCMQTDIVLTNRKIPPPDSPLRSRYMVFAVVLDEKPTDAKISDYAHVLEAALQTKEMNNFIHNQWLHAFYTYLLMRWNEMIIVPDPTMDACVTVTKLVFKALRDAEVIPRDVAMRTADMIMEIAKVRTYQLAVWRELFTEHGLLHHHFAKDKDGMLPDNYDDLKPASFHPDIFVTHCMKHLYCTTEIAVHTATACAQTYAPLISQKVLQYLKGCMMTKEIDVIETDPRYYTFTAPRKNVLLEKIAGRKMNKETVHDALLELSMRNTKIGSGESATYVPLAVSEENSSFGKGYTLKVSKWAIDSVSNHSSVDLELKMLECIEKVICHCFVYPGQRLLTSFFFTAIQEDEEKRTIKRFYDLNAVIHTRKLPTLHHFSNPIKLGDFEEALFLTQVKSGIKGKFKVGNTEDILFIENDFEEAAIAAHHLASGIAPDVSVHSANWANYCILLRASEKMPAVIRERFRESKMIRNYPYGEAKKDMKAALESYKKNRTMLNTAKLIDEFGVKNLDEWKCWVHDGEIDSLSSLLDKLKNQMEICEDETSQSNIKILEEAKKIGKKSDLKKFGRYDCGDLVDRISFTSKNGLKLVQQNERDKKILFNQDLENCDYDPYTCPQYYKYWEEKVLVANRPSKASILTTEDDHGKLQKHIMYDVDWTERSEGEGCEEGHEMDELFNNVGDAEITYHNVDSSGVVEKKRKRSQDFKEVMELMKDISKFSEMPKNYAEVEYNRGSKYRKTKKITNRIPQSRQDRGKYNETEKISMANNKKIGLGPRRNPSSGIPYHPFRIPEAKAIESFFSQSNAGKFDMSEESKNAYRKKMLRKGVTDIEKKKICEKTRKRLGGSITRKARMFEIISRDENS